MMALSGVRKLVGHVGEKLRLVPVGGFDLAALILDLAEQAGVLDRQYRLCGKGLKKIDHLWREGACLTTINRQCSHDLLVQKQRHREKRLITKSR